MKQRLTAVITLALLTGALLWWKTAHKPAQETQHAPEAAPVVTAKAKTTQIVPAIPELADGETLVEPPEPVTTQSAAVLPVPQPRVPASMEEPPVGPEVAPGLTPVIALENMRSAFRQYTQRFGGNPVGNNREITAALNGSNSKQTVFLNSEDGMVVNQKGELVDNWGTPYFFHQLSRTEMEIHSAGPDRKMWTRDDLVMK